MKAVFLLNLGLAAALMFSCVLRTAAQVPASGAKDTSLASALVAADLRADGVALAVDAAKINLPKDAAPTSDRQSIVDVADQYGRLAHRFGTVTAVAPPTMIVVGMPPEAPDPYDGMPPGDALKLLAGTLAPKQWKSLLNENGLGFSDLTDSNQRALFLALFPGGTLKVQWDRPNEANRDEDIQDLSSEIPQARLRLGQHVSLGLPVDGNPNIHTFGMSFQPIGAPKRYVQVGGAEVDADYVDGARVRAEVPNEPKPGGLDMNVPALQAAVSLNGLKTLGQLLLRIGNLCHIEIYADARVEGKSLTVAGATSAPASDLLQAVALCVCGTYRKVGPAYVLTDDILGIGTRRQRWADFEERAANLRREVLGQAGDAVAGGHTLDDVSAQGDPLGFTPAEVATFHKQHAGDLANHMMPSGEMMSVNLPFDKMTPGQQEVARRTAELYSHEGDGERPTLEGKIIVQSEVMLQLVLPSLDGPVEMQYRLQELFTPSRATINKEIDQADTSGQDAQTEWNARRRQAEVLPLAALLKGPAHRAVLAEPKTTSEVDALVVSAKALGLNELWLDAFSNGAAHSEVLAEALKVTAGSGIRVFAVLDLLRWGADAPSEAVDLTLRGDTSAQDTDRRNQDREARAASHRKAIDAPSTKAAPPVTVSVFSPLVRQRLIDLLRDLASRSDLAGMVWCDSAPPGYLPAVRMITANAPEPLGYAEAGRLAFLRQGHSDPVDLFPSEYQQGHADTRLPIFDNDDIDRALWQQWGQFRVSENLSFLHTLHGAVPRGETILIGARGPASRDTEEGPGWYGTWDGVARPPMDREEFIAGEAWQDEKTQAQSQSQLTLYPVRLPFGAVSKEFTPETLSFLKLQLHDAFKPGPKKSWDGYVLDATVPSRFQQLGIVPAADPLAALIEKPVKP